MMSQRAHRERNHTLRTRWMNGRPYVMDERGFLVPIPAGGSDDNDGQGAGGSSGGEGSEGGSGDGAEGAGGTEGEGSQEGDGDKKDEPVSRAEYEQALERMRAADRAKNQKDQELEELRQFKKEMEDKDRSELEKAQRDAEENASKAEAAQREAMEAKLKLQMVLANGKRDKKFRDPEDILRWVDVGDVTNDKGELDSKALEQELENLAKNKDYLLVDSSGGSEEEGEGEGEGSGGPSGTSQNKDKNKGKGVDREALARKYPALRR